MFVVFCFTSQNQSIAEPDLVPSCQCHVWSLKQDEEVCLDRHLITKFTAAPPIKVLAKLLGHYFILRNSKLFFFVVTWDQ